MKSGFLLNISGVIKKSLVLKCLASIVHAQDPTHDRWVIWGIVELF